MDIAPIFRQVRSPFTPDMLQPLDSRCRVVQFYEPLRDEDIRTLADFMRDYPQVALRVYGHKTVQNLEFLKAFSFLRKFQVDVFEIESLQGLEHLPDNLEFLAIGQTRRKLLSLKKLARFKQLHWLCLHGHDKDFEAIGMLSGLQKLTLTSITLDDLSALLPLTSLGWLHIGLGGTKDLSLLPRIGQIKYLELWRIMGLSNISMIGDIMPLQYLALQQLVHVSCLPSFKKLAFLRRVDLTQMKGLTDLSPLTEAPALEELMVVEAIHMKPADFACLRGHSSLKKFSAGLGSLERNEKVATMIPLPSAALTEEGFMFV